MNKLKLLSWPHIFAYLLVGVILGFFYGYGLYIILPPNGRTNPEPNKDIPIAVICPAPIKDNPTVVCSVQTKNIPNQEIPNKEALLLLTLAGSFGGLFYAMRDRKLEVPHKKSDKDNYINPGLLVDCFAGIAGAYVVFLISPVQLGELESIKILATGMLGGYGGRVLLDQALKGILKEDFEKLKIQVDENKEKINSAEEENKNGAKALATLDLYLDTAYHFSTEEEEEELKQEIQAASYHSKVIIFTKAREFREKNMFKNKKLMERAILVFQALIDSDTKKKYHRNYGQISCIYRDKISPDWMKVKQNLREAIKIRNRFEQNQKHEIFWLYELYLAVSIIKTTDDEKEIWKNLTTANSYIKTVSKKTETETSLWDKIIEIDEKFGREAKDANVKRENLQELIQKWVEEKTPNYSLKDLK